VLKDPELPIKMAKKAEQSISTFKISAFGFNTKGECVAKACNSPRFDRKGGGIHAEMKIMKAAMRKRIKFIVIFRIGKSGDFLPIEPCQACQAKADDLGIKILSLFTGADK
jgi:cytidine deaminase